MVLRWVAEKAIGHRPAKLPRDWPPKWDEPDSSLLIGQGMVVTSREHTRHCVAPGLLLKLSNSPDCTEERDGASATDIPAIPRGLCPVLCPCPWQGPCPLVPGSLTNTLPSTFTFSPIFVPFSGPESLQTCTWWLLDLFPTVRISAAQGPIPTWHMEWDTGNQSTVNYQPAGLHTPGDHNWAQHSKVESVSWGSMGHPTTQETSNPAQQRANECPEHPAEPDVHHVYTMPPDTWQRGNFRK